MTLMFIADYYKNRSVLHSGTMPNRSYFVPRPRTVSNNGELLADSACLGDIRQSPLDRSDRVCSLDGTWAFRYYRSIYDLDEDVKAGRTRFFEDGFDPTHDLGAGAFGSIAVPSTWECEGHGRQQYVNAQYPFPFDPPHVPEDNPCGVYVRSFDYHADPDAPRAFLDFEGVDSCFYVWLNGTFVGYSQVSHSTSEYEVSKALREGENTIAILVLKWCDGSYLEDQDKFRMSGIFRSVYLLRRPQTGIRDFFTHTSLAPDPRSADVTVDFDFLDGVTVPVTVTLLDAHGREIGRVVSHAVSGTDETGCPLADSADDVMNSGSVGSFHAQAAAEFHIDEPELWNAEEPYLYTLVFETGEPGHGEAITDRVGVREVCVRDGVFEINGSPVKLHGVNRHDSNPVTGFTVTREDMLTDLRLMKEHNVNAIRTSHYPNAPEFTAMCDELGFYIIAEADIESHGVEMQYGYGDGEPQFNWHGEINDNPQWFPSILDRVERSVERDKNHACVVIWSMGNEAGYGRGFERALAWTKGFDPSRLTHYESAFHPADGKVFDYSNLDLYSRMYPSIEEIREYFERATSQGAGKDGHDGAYGEGDDHAVRPYVLCEYCHAMGNGPGDLEDYFDACEDYPGFAGGFIWEWCDHAIDRGYTIDGQTIYSYGGDNGEYPDDGNFCMDGLVYPDRTPHTGLKEFKNVFRPLRVMDYDQANGALTLRNYMDFLNADTFTITWRLLVDGKMASEGIIAADNPALRIAPHQQGVVKLKGVEVPAKGKATLQVRYALRSAGAMLPAGFPLGFDEVALRNADGRNQDAVKLLESGDASAQAPVEMVSGPSAGLSDSRSANGYDLEGANSASDPAASNGVGEGNGVADSYTSISADVPSSISVGETSRDIVVSGSQWRYVYDKRTGMFSSLTFANRQLIDAPMEFNIWRAPTDNDINIRRDWQNARYDHASSRAQNTRVERLICLPGNADKSVESSISANEIGAEAAGNGNGQGNVSGSMSRKCNGVRISSSIAIASPSRQPVLRVDATWTVRCDGSINVSLKAQRDPIFPFLPRFGLRLFTPKAMNQVAYCGYGPNESYIDKHRSSAYGLYRSTPDAMVEPYIKPQENGSHYGCDYASVGDGNVTLAAVSPQPFSFQALPYTQEEMTAKGHRHELERCPSNVICFDYAQSGVGSNSCGPALAKRYRLDATEFTFNLTLVLQRDKQ